ncbi:GntR family transcriptional regulator [soil metagenome]
MSHFSYATEVASSTTRTEEVYDFLRSELLNGDLCPGQKLPMIELAQRFAVSQSVVREALTRLTEQHLVVAIPQRGFRVRELSIQDVTDLTEARVQVESVALRLAIERGDVHWETDVLTAHHILERTSVTTNRGTVDEEWSLRHRDFHRSLISGCNNVRLEVVANSLRDSAELYRRWTSVLTRDHYRHIASDHKKLKDLTLARDGDAAAALLIKHIERAPSQLVAYARKHGEHQLQARSADG